MLSRNEVDQLRVWLLGLSKLPGIETKPLAHTDPLGYTIALLPVEKIEWTGFINAVHARLIDPILLLNGLHYTPIHKDLLLQTIPIQAGTCVDNEIDGRKQIERSTVLGRLLVQRYFHFADRYADEADHTRVASSDDERVKTALTTPSIAADTPEHILRLHRHSALVRSYALGHSPHTQFTENWWDSTVLTREQRRQTLGTALKNLATKPVDVRRSAAINLAAIPDMPSRGGAEEKSPKSGSAKNSPRVDRRKHRQIRRKHLAVLARVEAPFFLGRGALLSLWHNGCAEGFGDPGAACAAIMLAGALPPENWRTAQLEDAGQYVVIGTPITHPVGESWVDLGIHIPTEGTYWRHAPAIVGELVRRHQGPSAEEITARGDSWLTNQWSGMTVARLKQCLMWHASLASASFPDQS